MRTVAAFLVAATLVAAPGHGQVLTIGPADVLAAAAQQCFSVRGIVAYPADLRIEVFVGADGALARTPNVEGDANTADERLVADAAQQAVLRCAPYRLLSPGTYIVAVRPEGFRGDAAAPVAQTHYLHAVAAAAAAMRAERNAKAAAEARAALTDGRYTLSPMSAPWEVVCRTDAMTDVKSCRLSAITLAKNPAGEDKEVMIAIEIDIGSKWLVAVRASGIASSAGLRVDTLPAVFATACDQGCLMSNNEATVELVEAMFTGVTLLVRYEAGGVNFDGRILLDGFPAMLETFVAEAGRP